MRARIIFCFSPRIRNLQHYPMYRESDAICNEVDEAPTEIKDVKFREHWECLSKEASEQLFEILNPRLVVDGHTHHGCRKIHGDDILEITIPSFSWRNKDNPSYLMVSLKKKLDDSISHNFVSQ